VRGWLSLRASKAEERYSASVPNPVYLRSHVRDRRCGAFRIADDDRGDWGIRRRNAELGLGFSQSEPRARKANAAGAEAHTVRGEHQVLRRQATILGGLSRIGRRGDHNQLRRPIKDIE